MRHANTHTHKHKQDTHLILLVSFSRCHGADEEEGLKRKKKEGIAQDNAENLSCSTIP